MPICRVDRAACLTAVNEAWLSLPPPLCDLVAGSPLPNGFSGPQASAILAAIAEAGETPERPTRRIVLQEAGPDDAFAFSGAVVISVEADGCRVAVLLDGTVGDDGRPFSPVATAAAHRRARLDATLRALPDNLFELDSTGRFINYHAGNRSGLAVPPGMFLGRSLEDVLPPDVASVGRAAMADVDLTGRSDGRQYRLDNGSTEAWFELSAAALDLGPQGGGSGYVFLSRDITERVRARRELEGQKSLLAALFDLSKIGITLMRPADGHLVDVNPAFLRQFGYDRDDLASIDLRTLIPAEFAGTREHAAKQLAATGTYGPFEVGVFAKDGMISPTIISGCVVKDIDGNQLVWSMLEDITEVRARERRLQAAELEAITARQRLWTAVESLSDGFILFDSDDRLVMANRSYRELYADSGYVAVPGIRFADIVRDCMALGDYPDAIGQEEAFFAQRMADHQRCSGVIEQRLRDGRIVRIIERRTPDGGIVALHVVVTELHDAREKALEASRVKSAFLANMSHEIRNPLTAILGATEVLSGTITGPDDQRLLQSIQRSGETLMVILNDLLDMSKIEAGKMSLERHVFALDMMLDPIESLYKLKAGDRGIGFRVATDGQLSRPRIGDSHRIAQILHNLLSNAVKFTEKGEVELRVSAPPSGLLTLVVRDTGIGMDEKVQARIFQPFEQAAEATARQYGGTGLGMSIIRRLVDLMAGSITLTSAPNKGTTVTVTLPVPVATDTPRAKAPARPANNRLDGLRVLVTDDSDINRTILEAFLTGLGADVVLADRGESAIAAWAPGRFDVVCLDISMPGLDGVETLARLRGMAAEAGVDMPYAIAITGNALPSETVRYMAAGFAAHLPKPFRRDQLAATIRSLMAIKKPSRP